MEAKRDSAVEGPRCPVMDIRILSFMIPSNDLKTATPFFRRALPARVFHMPYLIINYR